MKNVTLFEKLNQWIATSITIKLISIGVLILVLLIPMNMIKNLIEEREMTQASAIAEVQQKWGNAQEVTGPVLSIPYKSFYTKIDKDGEEKQFLHTKYAHFLPETLNISGTINPEIRNRSIYEIIVYDSQLNVSGVFSKPNFDKLKIDSADVIWDNAFLSMGIPDLRGIKENINVTWNNEQHVFEAGSNIQKILPSGVNAEVGVVEEQKSYNFEMKISMNGSRSLSFVPLGKETDVRLKSTWADPSFEGAFLPDKRTVSDEGFEASWKVLNLNRNFPQQWLGDDIEFTASSFGVNLLLPVDQYQKSMRSAKYATLFIGLTFMIFFFVEVKNRMRIHPFQYILVGLALCVFYTLLLSLSEHINFNFAYTAATLGIIGIITSYSNSIFKSRLLTYSMMGFLIALYSFMFVIIRSQDFALLIGSLALFIILAVVMYLSKNIDWYENVEEKLEVGKV
ncbi:MAG: cell envelope integrity protein CreD [Cyclobacteriaceae bacterium]